MNAAGNGMAIKSIAAYAPPDVKSNDWVAAQLLLEKVRYQERLVRQLTAEEDKAFETSDRWIRRFIGFTERRFVAQGEGTIDLAVRAAQLLLQSGSLDPSQVDAIVFATVTPSYHNSPPDAALLQQAMGIPEYVHGQPHELYGVDVSLACSSWVAGVRLAYALIKSNQAKRVLLIGSDAMSTTINWRDRAFATVLGDAGTAMELIAVPEDEDWFSPAGGFWSWLGGSQAETIITPQGGSRDPLRKAEELLDYRNRLTMDGRIVKELIVPFIGGPGVDAALRKAGLTLADLDVAVLHEANLVLNAEILKAWRERGFRGTVLDAGGRYGNTTSASIPLALALHPEALTVGSRFLLFGFGGGFSATSAIGTIKSPITVVTDV
ncbi:MAG: hypothetical protein HY566_01740 [Candidatus Kerfeldbacteria bacterium]|nr:hypothetical protein [Candidatus Kerfeldbacteria bacterium]